ncbi:MAG: hypothetical protein Q8O52_15300 [Sulfuritalea sp.]|nr:hypothetical protein [Sulfuritalea sp.]
MTESIRIAAQLPVSLPNPVGLRKLAALFVIALGVSTLWQGMRFYLVMYKRVV